MSAHHLRHGLSPGASLAVHDMIKPPKNLTRNTVSGCVMARISRNKVQHARNFTLVEYGTWRKAEQAASQWIDEIKRELPPPATAKDNLTTRNASGVVGVNLKTSNKGAATHYAWHAFWPDNTIGTTWSVGKYGDEPAFVRAVLSRQLETTDRDAIETAFAKIRGTSPYRSILKQKAMELV